MDGQDRHAKAPEEPVDLTPQFAKDVLDALGKGRARQVEERLGALHRADIADLLGWASPEERFHLVEILRPNFNPEILTELADEITEEVVAQLGVRIIAEAICELETDDAVEVVEDLPKQDQQQIMQALPAQDRADLETALSYPEYSAGRLLQRQCIAVPDFWTVGQTIDFLRASRNLPDDFYDIFVVDPRHHPVGAVRLSKLLRAARPVAILDLMGRETLRTIDVNTDQSDVAHLFRQRDLTSAPVTDAAGRLLGAITIDDVVDVIDEEHEEDVMRMAGVGEADDLSSSVLATARGRSTWLAVNAFTALMAACVIAVFEGTIDQLVVLAILLPVVASMGGNAGMQTLTVAVRSLATRELSPTNAGRVIFKELKVGLLNGLVFALLMAAVAGLWFGNMPLALVIGAAMVINFVTAGLAGTLVPIGLERAGVDPAIASGVFLTTITDLVGFFAFLGLASYVLL